jgi:large subunit ribosomal protein L9
MKVVFLEEVEGTARTGDVKNVANGFARNFLLPRKLAAPATAHYIAIADARATKEAKKQDRLDEEARDRLLPKVDGQSYSTEVRVGDQGKLFGSVTAREIAEMVQEGTGIEIEHKQIDIKEPIRELGNYDITVKLTRNVLATVSLSVEPIGGMPEVEEAAPEEDAEVATEEETAVTGEADETAEAEASVDAGEEAESELEAESAAEPDTEVEDEPEGEPESAAEETETGGEEEPEEEKAETE